jgi:hypothetical protein
MQTEKTPAQLEKERKREAELDGAVFKIGVGFSLLCVSFLVLLGFVFFHYWGLIGLLLFFLVLK